MKLTEAVGEIRLKRNKKKNCVCFSSFTFFSFSINSRTKEVLEV